MPTPRAKKPTAGPPAAPARPSLDIPLRSVATRLLWNRALYEEVVVARLCAARESVWISTANVKEMYIEDPGGVARRGRTPYRSILEVFAELAERGVELRILHAELPSKPFRAAFDRLQGLWSGGLHLKICPRVHFKAVLVDGAWVYLGSANLTGAGLGAKHEHKRNFELGFVTEDFEVIDQVTAQYQAIWSGAECGLCQRRDLCPDPLGPPSPEGRPRGRGTKKGSALVRLRRR